MCKKSIKSNQSKKVSNIEVANLVRISYIIRAGYNNI